MAALTLSDYYEYPILVFQFPEWYRALFEEKRLGCYRHDRKCIIKRYYDVMYEEPVINTLRRDKMGVFECIFLNDDLWVSINVSLFGKFVPKGQMNNIPAPVQIMTWRRPGDESLSESVMVSLPTHICVTRPQWVNGFP